MAENIGSNPRKVGFCFSQGEFKSFIYLFIFYLFIYLFIYFLFIYLFIHHHIHSLKVTVNNKLKSCKGLL